LQKYLQVYEFPTTVCS